ncbi:MAG: glycosyltransferase [Candidatus Aenigmarchaeota archaeon]|nr:glycosyltransferase [Candidatus Aenigmarchaeota archaeon]
MVVKKITVLYLITANTYGGAEHAVYKLAKNLNTTFFSPVVACLGNNSTFINRLRDSGIKIYPLNMKSVLDFRVIQKLYTILKKEKVDIIHTQLFKSDFLGRITGKLAGTKIIISTIQNMESFRRFRILNFIDRITSFLTYKIISVSDLVRDFTIAKTGLPVEKFTTIYNFVDMEDHNPSAITLDERRDFRKKLGIGEDNIVIGTIGRLAPQKSQKDLILAAKQVTDRYPQARFVIAGEGPLKQELMERIEQLSLTGKVIFTGFVEDTNSIFSIIDMFVLSSLWEGLPLTICEAMSWSVPVVSTDAGGVPEIVENGVTGLLTRAGDYKQLAEAICLLLSDRKLQHSLTEAARMRVEEKFSLKTVLMQIEELYLEAAKSKAII